MSESKTPRVSGDERNYPLPEYLQLIQFEGATCGVIAPEEYEELFTKACTLELELNEAKEAFQKQRENYIKLYEAVVGEGCVVGWPDPVQIATELRSQLTTAQQEIAIKNTFIEEVREFTTVCVCGCGDKMRDTDLTLFLNRYDSAMKGS